MFDITLQVASLSVGTDQNGEELVVSLQSAIPLPFAAPGSSQPIAVPIANISFSLDRDAAIKVGEQFKDEGEKLKPKSRLTVASDLSGVDQATAFVDKLKDGDN